MATILSAGGDGPWKRDSCPGYRLAWKDRDRFEKGRLDGGMNDCEARRKAAELQADSCTLRN